MAVYSVNMFAVSALLAVFSFLLHNGKTDLIHDYHQTRVTDKHVYGKAFGKAIAVMAGACSRSVW